MFNITTAVFGSHHLLLHVLPVNFFFFFRKSCRLWDNVEENCTRRQATHNNIIWRMLFK